MGAALHCGAWASLIAVVSLVAALERRLCSCGVWAVEHAGARSCSVQARQLLLTGSGVGSVVVVHRLGCPAARAVFPDPGPALCALHCQAHSSHCTTTEVLPLVF